MARIPQLFRGNQSPSIASYDYVDIANGTGYITFYGFNGSNSGSTSYALTNQVAWSAKVVLPHNAGVVSAYTKTAEYNFDTILNTPRVVRGKAIINVPLSVTATAGNYNYAYASCAICKVVSGVETVVGWASGALVEQSNAGTNHIQSGIVFDCPQTNIKKGETLRLSVEVWSFCNSTGATDVGSDPKNRTATAFGTDPTQLKADIPFRINI